MRATKWHFHQMFDWIEKKQVLHLLIVQTKCFMSILWNMDLPGIVLSSTNATEPPTNMAVVSRTFSTWSICTIPTKKEKNMVPHWFLEKQSSLWWVYRIYTDLCIYQWLEGFLWGSWAGPGQRRWKNQGQTDCGMNWDPQTAGWKDQRRWSCRRECKTVLPELDPAMMQRERWIYRPFLVVASVPHHTELPACCPPTQSNTQTEENNQSEKTTALVLFIKSKCCSFDVSNINVFIDTFDQINASLQKKILTLNYY